jgi:hypothetical protein
MVRDGFLEDLAFTVLALRLAIAPFLCDFYRAPNLDSVPVSDL